MLLTRLRAHLRIATPSSSTDLVFDELRIDVEGFRVFVGSSEVLMRPKEVTLLVRLAASAGRVLSRDQLRGR